NFCLTALGKRSNNSQELLRHAARYPSPGRKNASRRTTMRTPRLSFLISLAILFLIPSCTRAQQVLFSSFGPGQTFQNGGFGLYDVPNQPEVLPSELAASFTPTGFTLSGHYTLMQIDLGM